MSESGTFRKMFTTPRLLTRADVRVSRQGWISTKDDDALVGSVSPATNPAGESLWRAGVGDTSTWAFKRAEAIEKALDLHNLHEKARSFDLLHPEYKAAQQKRDGQ